MSSCNFLEVCRDVTKTARKIPQSDYLSQGNYKIFDQGKQYIAGYTDNNEGIVSDYPYIVFGDHTRILKFIKEPCFIGADGVKLLKVYNEDFTPQYVYYALLAQPIENQGYSRHFKYLKEKSIPFYSLEKQNAIVSELDKIQSALDNKKEQLKKLDELIQSKFYEMFGDPLVNDKGWEFKKLGEMGKIASGGTPSRSKSEYFSGDINWYSAGELNTLYLPDSIEKITEKAISESSAKLFPKGSLLIGMYDTAAFKLGILKKDSASNQACANITLHEGCVTWLYYTLKSMREEALRFRHGARQKNLNVSFIKSFSVPLPPLPFQQAFAAYVEKVEQAKTIVNQEIAHLQELLNSRMDFYFRK